MSSSDALKQMEDGYFECLAIFFKSCKTDVKILLAQCRRDGSRLYQPPYCEPFAVHVQKKRQKTGLLECPWGPRTGRSFRRMRSSPATGTDPGHSVSLTRVLAIARRDQPFLIRRSLIRFPRVLRISSEF